MQGAFPTQQTGFVLSSLSLVSAQAGTPGFQLVIKIFYGMLKGFNGMVFNGEFIRANTPGCRRFVLHGVRNAGGRGDVGRGEGSCWG